MDFSSFDPLYAVSGLAVGALVGLTGVGGGSLMTPLLVLLFGVHPATAVGTDLLYAAVTKSAGTLVHGVNRTIDWRIVGRLAAGSVPAAILTLWALSGIDTKALGIAKTISTVLGYALLLTATILLFRTRLAAWLQSRRAGRTLPPRVVSLATVLFGAALGLLVTISSVGAGAIGVTVLLMLYPMLPTARIVGSDIVHAVPLTLVAGLGYWWIGSVDVAMLVSLLAGSIPGVVAGSTLSPRVPDGILRPLLASVLLLVGVKLVLA
ncbi:sulfite exporter TauE/SafE family protein [Oharaeibacter diazotrophicus]|uniref:Probable membrane transporter protein n=1 Tax=Oharaeibacter diazotrophicus TaxID=1920512 RepID=A0A4V3CVY9_9HYPH|nr:sulfite exporter TauE/SafE family protein [Oharaeibacter diazotrophicus]TDP84288.1 hypothetical protein EDD54_2894 [Oharaeibacter diazotrophicus]BBE73325.1 sulfite exporter TauE/SafE [Pleomorphomonas sp. SM30]GLS75116.1 UPF0721 transmembrane protein [Oharaeibacter diazotrophicus]